MKVDAKCHGDPKQNVFQEITGMILKLNQLMSDLLKSDKQGSWQ